VRLAAVTSVSSTADLSQARVQVSVLGSEEERSSCIDALRHAKGFVRSQLASRLRLRTVPELLFELDRGAEYSQRISQILEGLHDSEPGS
jgi:ribosome-binding factor A